jgi:hypothetical protein
MATRAQQFRAEQQQRGAKESKEGHQPAVKQSRSGDISEAHPNKHAEKKATYALEAPASDGRRSRKSTRASANRSKPDANFNLREMRQKGSPENRFAKAQARATRARGHKDTSAS